MEALVVAPSSQASANQRAGRAGRTTPGKCFRFVFPCPKIILKDCTRKRVFLSFLLILFLKFNALIWHRWFYNLKL